MCGRMTLKEDPTVVGEQLGAQVDPQLTTDWRPRFNVAPTQRHPVLRLEDGVRWLRAGRWGLRREGDKRLHINARSETVKHLPAFREAFKSRRCVVPADGFYEWIEVDGAKQPVWFHRSEGGLLLFAGLWEPGPTPETTMFTVLTTTPNVTVAPMHDRMPVILDPSDVESWLEGSVERRLLAPAPDTLLTSRWANRTVNNVRNDDQTCLEYVPVETVNALRLDVGGEGA